MTMDEVRAAAWELDEYKRFAEKDPAPRSPSDGTNPPVGGGVENPPTMGGGNENPPTMGGGDENPPTMGGGDENPPAMGVGGSNTTSRGDNPPTGGTGSTGAGVTALAACGLGFHFFKKKRGY